ncbi:UPF0280 family protein [Pelagibius litoralis]|uniref:UPF0280 family protein n=1 Tax=Pelagibius litoralis TaxID=374515 RepID=A0A967EYY6_9PROT|nr:UPF0280 family protein [Pelagibius litoralis]NIA70012.1 UPF0280 family protein [Pelagibius litoralis]
MRESIQARNLADGRLHLHEGPIDLIIEAFGDQAEIRKAYAAAAAVFQDVLPDLVNELPLLRHPLCGAPPGLKGAVARRMQRACAAHRPAFVTPMAAVAGAVADHILSAMTAVADLRRAYVNDGGDIALHLSPGESLACGLVAEIEVPRLTGRAVVCADMPVRGIATSGRATLGQGGRSFSLGIADAVSVFAQDAATADVAATLLANAVNLPGHSAIRRCPVEEVDPESDLQGKMVTLEVGDLSLDELRSALGRGAAAAEEMRSRGLIEAAVLFLRGEVEVVAAPRGLLAAA